MKDSTPTADLERRRYEGTGHGQSLDARIAAFRRTGQHDEPPAPEGVLGVVAPPRYRDVTEAMKHQRCVCGVRIPWHYDGWDGNRLDCEEAQRRERGR